MRSESAKSPAANSPLIYRGRFAPSPTGPLHFGSLVAAVASYLDARAHQGAWLVRMEDIDPPREVPGAADTILKQLEAHGLYWDMPLLYQSSRAEAYQEAIDRLAQSNLTYPCTCSRGRIRELGGIYDGLCRQRRQPPPPGYALRIRVPDNTLIGFDDIFQGQQQADISRQSGDYVIHRRDGRFAYQLAVTLDDAWQGITHVIRGADLLDSTPKQLFLFQQWGQAAPRYGHLPVALNAAGDKLSKQNRAQALDSGKAVDNLCQVLAWLGQPTPKAWQGETPEQLLAQAAANWNRASVPRLPAINAPADFYESQH